MKKIAANRNYRLMKRAEERVPFQIYVSGSHIPGMITFIKVRGNGADAKGVNTSWTMKEWQGAWDAESVKPIINEAKTFIAGLKQKYPNVKMFGDEIKPPLTPAMFGL